MRQLAHRGPRWRGLRHDEIEFCRRGVGMP